MIAIIEIRNTLMMIVKMMQKITPQTLHDFRVDALLSEILLDISPQFLFVFPFSVFLTKGLASSSDMCFLSMTEAASSSFFSQDVCYWHF
jgi:hypothetical protein